MTSKNNPCRLFVNGLPYKFREGQLLSLFVTCGKVIDVRIIQNHWGRSRGMGYVEFDNPASASAAKQKFHNYKIAPDRHLIVDYARPAPVGSRSKLVRQKNHEFKRKPLKASRRPGAHGRHH